MHILTGGNTALERINTPEITNTNKGRLIGSRLTGPMTRPAVFNQRVYASGTYSPLCEVAALRVSL